MANMDGLRSHLQQWTNDVMVAALQRTQEATQEAAPVRTGALRNSITTTAPQVDSLVARAETSADMPYAGFTDAGTQPHPIYPVRARVLAFFWERLGKDVFLRFVNHPGTKGTQWFNAGNPGGEPMLTRWHDALSEAAGQVN